MIDDDDEDDLSLELLDWSSVGSSCTGGKAGVSVRAVHLVPNSKAFPVFRATMKFLNVSSGTRLWIVLAPIAPFFVPTMCSGFVSDLPNQILLSYAVSPYGVSFLMTIHDVLVPRSWTR